MDAVVYARISRDTAGEGMGVKRQVEDCRAKAASLGWTVVDTHEDNDLSASKSVPRPEYERLLSDIESGKVRAVVVYDLDRLTRKPAELEHFIDLADRTGVALANVSGDVDLATANGRMLARIKGAVARQEADRISERTKRQKVQARAEGKPLGGRFRLYGYDRSWAPIEAEANVVREIFTRARMGEAHASITRDLQARGVTTVTGGKWLPLQTTRVLRTHRYAGLTLLDGTVHRNSQVVALVSEADFEAVQKPTSGQRRGNGRKMLLSGFAICDACKSKMTGSGTGRYRCDVNMGGCGKVGIRADWVDFPISLRVKGYHQQTRMADPFKAHDHSADIAGADSRIEALQARYDAGELDLDDLVPLLAVERRKRKEAVSRAAEDTSAVDQVLRGVEEYEVAPIGVQREILARYVKHVVIKASGKGRQPHQSRGRIEVHWSNGFVENLATYDGPPLEQWWPGDE